MASNTDVVKQTMIILLSYCAAVDKILINITCRAVYL